MGVPEPIQEESSRMRAKLAVIPLVAGLALLGGCATQNPTNTPSSPAVTTPAGNGVDKLTADEILTKAKAALKKQKAFHVKGLTTEGTNTVDLDFTFSGANAAGTVKSTGLTLEVTVIGKDLYMKAPDAFWTSLIQDPTVLAAVKGKYVKLDGSKSEFSTFMDKSAMYISTEGDPLPLRSEKPGSTDAIVFTYEGVADVKAPAAADVYDLSKVL
jgi:hypothetical protein